MIMLKFGVWEHYRSAEAV